MFKFDSLMFRNSVLTIFAVLYFLMNPVFSEMKMNPDENTLWREDGIAIISEDSAKASKEYWAASQIQYKEAPDKKGFIISATDGTKYAGMRYVEYNPEYPYLYWEITDAVLHTGYHNFGIQFTAAGKNIIVETVSHYQNGVYYIDISKGIPNAVKGTCLVTFYLYNSDITLKEIKMIKKPPYLVTISSEESDNRGKLKLGDKVTVKIEVPRSAEDVTLQFFDWYTMPQLKINGETSFQLKPMDKIGKIWSISMPIDTVEDNKWKKPVFAPGHFFFKVLILGGGIKVPVFTVNTIDYDISQD